MSNIVLQTMTAQCDNTMVNEMVENRTFNIVMFNAVMIDRLV
jgi:hypothetical protein